MPKKKITTKEKLMVAATELFLKKGVDRVGVREIAARAGSNLSLMNYYFQSKEKLVEHIFENMIITKATHLKEVLDTDTPLKEKIMQYVSEYIKLLTENPLIVSFFMTILHRNPEMITTMPSVKVLYNSEVFCQQLNDEIQAGRIRSVDPEQIFISMVSLIIFPFAIKELIMDRNSFAPEQFIKFADERKELVTQMLLRYLEM